MCAEGPLTPASESTRDVRFVAFYLPQFHPIPENDVWWGPGYTEWRAVANARPLFDGHEQPRLPADLGYYDLRLPETRNAQAALAAEYGIDAFAYYHYWFSGRRLLNRPFDEVRSSGSPSLPFCLCWANEPWSRTWSGRGSSFLVSQTYSHDDDLRHAKYLVDVFRDERYLRVADRPLMLVYNLAALPEPRRTIELWSEQCDQAGVGVPYIVKCDTFLDDGDPHQLGADAACDFLPHGASRLAPATAVSGPGGYESIDYGELANGYLARRPSRWTRYPCVVPDWDNSPRRPSGDAFLLRDASPEIYEHWLTGAARRIRAEVEHPLVFVNAWNEWGEGAYLEPDLRSGRAYLEATRRARRAVQPDWQPAVRRVDEDEPPPPTDVGVLYERAIERVRTMTAEAAQEFDAGQALMRDVVEAREAELAALRADLDRVGAWGDTLDAELRALQERTRASALVQRVEALDEASRAAEAELAAVKATLSWRLSRRAARLPGVAAAVRWVRRAFRRRGGRAA